MGTRRNVSLPNNIVTQWSMFLRDQIWTRRDASLPGDEKLGTLSFISEIDDSRQFVAIRMICGGFTWYDTGWSANSSRPAGVVFAGFDPTRHELAQVVNSSRRLPGLQVEAAAVLRGVAPVRTKQGCCVYPQAGKRVLRNCEQSASFFQVSFSSFRTCFP